MINLSECKFGDRLKTRNGELTIYVGRDTQRGSHFVVCNSVEYGYAMLYPNDNGIVEYFDERCYDIIGKWEDEK